MEKQFYQDQAKQLKDSFNRNYPDYVYRRRPNNSRRKRKPDSSGLRQEKSVPSDMGDDVFGKGEFITDIEDPQDDLLDSHQNSYSDYKFTPPHTRESFPPYPYAETDDLLRSNRTREGSLYTQDSSNTDRLSNGVQPSTSIVPPQLTHSLPYPNRSHSYPAPMFGQEYSQETYETLQARPASWSTRGSHDHIAVQKSHSFSTSGEGSAWSRTAAPPNRTTQNTTLSHTYVLSTLNSPFYPNQSSPQSSISSPAPQFNPSIMLPMSSPKTDPDNYIYTASPSSCSPTSAISDRDAQLYSRHTNPYFPQFHPLQHSSIPRSGHCPPPQAYWQRE
jgi:hypothetical protein